MLFFALTYVKKRVKESFFYLFSDKIITFATNLKLI